MKKIISVAMAFLMLFSVMVFTPNIKADAATSGIYTYEVQESMAFITKVNSSSSNIVMPEKIGGYPVAYIAPLAFSSCSSVTEITLPANMILVDVAAFYGCSNLKNIYVNSKNQYYTSVNGVLFDKNKKILCAYPRLKGNNYTVPNGTEIIDAYAFAGTRIEDVTLPSTLTTIGYAAFAECTGIKYFTMPNSVTTVDEYAFAECSFVKGVTLSNRLTEIKDYTFYKCASLPLINIPDSVKSIGKEAFSNCRLYTVSIGKGVETIDMSAFTGNSYMTSIKVSAANQHYSADAQGALYSKDKSILYMYPKGRSDTTYYVHPNTKHIERAALDRSGLKKINFPEGVETIGEYACDCVYDLHTFIPSSVTSIPDNAFINGYDDDRVIYGTLNEDGTSVAKEYAEKKNIPFIPVYFTRLAGTSRYDTAVEISEKGWEKADTVILANGLNYADALAGVSLGGVLDAPILLTAGKATLEDSVLAEIEKLQPTNIILLGGYGAVSDEIMNFLSETYTVERLSGMDRYGTALEISKKVASLTNPTEAPAPTATPTDAPAPSVDTAIVVTGTGYADSLSISPIAAMYGYPIIYANPANGLSDEALEFLAGTEDIIIVGGVGVVTEVTEEQLEGKNINRIFGLNRYLTSYAVAEEFRDSFGEDVMIATGMNFPDALAGGVLAAKLKTPLLLTQNTGMIDEMKNYVASRNHENIYVLGGEGVIPSLTVAELFG